MSDLQILLVSIGVVLIVVVLAYNAWQDWRARRHMRQTLSATGGDVLMQGQGEGAAAARREPGLRQEAAADESAEVDATCEAVIDIGFAHPQSGAALASALQAVTRIEGKPVRVFAQRESGGQRTVLRPDEQYVAVQLAVLLANRSGALTAIEWSRVWTQAQNLAAHFDGAIEAPEQEAVLQRASALDGQCAAMDAQVGLILQLAQAQPHAHVVQVATEAGFVAVRKRLTWLAENGLPRFFLSTGPADADTTHRVDLILDVPNSLPDDQAFSRMLAVARDLAARLEAQVLDDQGRTFDDRAASTVDEQISALYDQLDQAGFLAGTERAARIFS